MVCLGEEMRTTTSACFVWNDLIMAEWERVQRCGAWCRRGEAVE